MPFKIVAIDDRERAQKNLRRLLSELSQLHLLEEECAFTIDSLDDAQRMIAHLAGQSSDLVVALDLIYDDTSADWSELECELESYKHLWPTDFWRSYGPAKQGLGAALVLSRARRDRGRTLFVVSTSIDGARYEVSGPLQTILQSESLDNVAVVEAAEPLAGRWEEINRPWTRLLNLMVARWPLEYFPPLFAVDRNNVLGRILRQLFQATACEVSSADRTRWTHNELNSRRSKGVATLADIFRFEQAAFEPDLAKALMQCGEGLSAGICCYNADQGSPWCNSRSSRPIRRRDLEQILRHLEIKDCSLEGEFFRLPRQPGLPFLFSLKYLTAHLQDQASEAPSVRWVSTANPKRGRIEIRLSHAFPAYGLRDESTKREASGSSFAGVSRALTDFHWGRISELHGDDPLSKLFRGERLPGPCLPDNRSSWPEFEVLAEWPCGDP